MAVPGLERAHGDAIGSGRIRVAPEDFRVVEQLGFAPDGAGRHVLLRVLKRGANTGWVARELARAAGVAEREVGFAGLKDRHAVTEQFFTVPAGKRPLQAWIAHCGSDYRVLEATPHGRKLRRGAHRGNAFDITVRLLEADWHALERRLHAVGVQGVPNYFGPQRFGHEGANLARARLAFAQRRLPRNRAARAMLLSAARAAVFNELLAVRVQAGTWNTLRVGDVANLDGSGSIFPVAEIDERLAARCAGLDLHPTGPLWGRRDVSTAGEIRALEERVAAQWSDLCEGLSAAGLEQERRALRVRVRDLEWTFTGDRLQLCFELPRGAYATAVINEILDVVDAAAEQ